MDLKPEHGALGGVEAGGGWSLSDPRLTRVCIAPSQAFSPALIPCTYRAQYPGSGPTGGRGAEALVATEVTRLRPMLFAPKILGTGDGPS